MTITQKLREVLEGRSLHEVLARAEFKAAFNRLHLGQKSSVE